MNTMNRINKACILFLIMTSISTVACKEVPDNKTNGATIKTIDIESEKKAILETLNSETKAFFNRDYEGWKSKWIHEPFVTKSYMLMTDSTLSETLGWDAIDTFGKTYIDQHPEPDPIPTLLDKINVRFYGDGAWVSFEQNDAVRGLKRETRLMEKINGQWKIAGMHTTIYGFKE